jgi:hypothetical protein
MSKIHSKHIEFYFRNFLSVELTKSCEFEQ